MLPFDDFDVLTFDCYGTLIDWESGLWTALHPILAQHRITLAMDEALAVLKREQTQKSILGRMQTRQELYDLLGYEATVFPNRKA